MENTMNVAWAGLVALAVLPLIAAYVSTEGFDGSGYGAPCYASAGQPGWSNSGSNDGSNSGSNGGSNGASNVSRDFVVATGEATVSVDATVMIAELKFVGNGKSAKAAYDSQRAVMDKVIAMLKSRNVTEMQTAYFEVEPVFSEKLDQYVHSDWQEISSYKVQNTLIIKVRDPAIFNEVLVDAVDMGVNDIANMRFIPDAGKIRDAKRRVRVLALEDAKENAAWQAGVIGMSLGKLVTVGDSSQEVVQSYNQWYGYGASQMDSNMATQTSMYLSDGPVEEVESMSPGTVTFRASVSLGYLLGAE